MAEENKTESPAADSKSDSTVVTKRESVEVLNSDGSPLVSKTADNLAGIFDKVAAGTPVKDAIQTSLVKPKTEKVEEKKVEEKKVEEKKVEEKKVEEKKTEAKVEEKKEETPPPAEDDNERKKLVKGLFDDDKKKDADKKADDEKKVAKAAEDKKEETEEVTEDELAVLPHDKPKTAKRIQVLLRKVEEAKKSADTTQKERDELKKQLESAQAATKDPRSDEAIQKELKELAQYRRRYQLESDPEAKKQLSEKFDARIVDAEKSILEVLKAEALDASLAKMIEDAGGFAKFAQNDSQSIRLKDGADITFMDMAEEILTKLPRAKSDYIRAKMMEQINTRDDRRRYVEAEVSKANEYFTEQDKLRTQQQAQFNEKQQGIMKEFDSFYDKAVGLDWMKDAAVPADATADTKKAFDEENAFRKQLREVLKRTLKTQSIAELTDAALDSVAYYNERRENLKLRAQIKALEDKLQNASQVETKRKQAASTVLKGGSLGASNASAEAEKKDKAPQSLEEAFAKIASSRQTLVADEQ